MKDAHLIPRVLRSSRSVAKTSQNVGKGLAILRNKCATSAGRLHGGRKSPGARPRSDQSTPFSITTIGIEIGKNTFHLLGLDQGGNIVLQSPVRAIDQKLAIQGELRKNLDARANQADHSQTAVTGNNPSVPASVSISASQLATTGWREIT